VSRDEPEAEEPAAEPEPAPVESTPEVDDGRPKRTGWWSRRSSFF
jgi:ribonuclease E